MKINLLFYTGLVLFIIGCKPNEVDPPAPEKFNTEMAGKVVENYSGIVLANYSDVKTQVGLLKTSIQELTTNPSVITLTAARQAWINVRHTYGQSEAYRLYGGPIDGEDGPESLINGWPLDEAYIDYVDTSATEVIKNDYTSGIINQPGTYPVISKELLVSLNEKDGETNIATGFHAIEFLLWGQDKSVTGPGERSFKDFIVGGNDAANQSRRNQYLSVCVDLLQDNIQTLINDWNPEVANNFYADFSKKENVKESVGKILRGIGALSVGELAGERMTPALRLKDQEEEHSCFSDNTDQDIKLNIKGIDNVYNGRYMKSDGTVIQGTSLADLVNKSNPATNTAVVKALQDCKASSDKITAPFDQAILNNRAPIENTIEQLKNLSFKIVDAGSALGIEVSTELE